MSTLEDLKKLEEWVHGRGPPTPPSFHFGADKWDDNYARNLCLTFIHDRGLDAEFMDYIKSAQKVLGIEDRDDAA